MNVTEISSFVLHLFKNTIHSDESTNITQTTSLSYSTFADVATQTKMIHGYFFRAKQIQFFLAGFSPPFVQISNHLSDSHFYIFCSNALIPKIASDLWTFSDYKSMKANFQVREIERLLEFMEILISKRFNKKERALPFRWVWLMGCQSCCRLRLGRVTTLWWRILWIFWDCGTNTWDLIQKFV